MTLAAGTRLGPYEITAKLGEGGMGLVFRARDFHLGRDVALKVLPDGFTEDPERLSRFEREAKLLAQLNHPNIAQIYGFEASGETRALVMELVEGPTLAERLEQGPLPFDQSLAISLQIAHALEEAHEKGIVHRDLKPQNIKASIEGKVKVLDFGLAKALDSAGSSSALPADLAHSPTVTFGGTQEGVILGTAAYMAPEQARGGAVDKRADIWAFGVVLYEMLSGERLFAEGSVVDTLSAVMRKEIDFARLPATVPRRLPELVRRCLERDPRRRLRDIGDARIVLEEVIALPEEERPPAAASTAPGSPAWLRAAPWIVALAALAAVVVLLAERGSRLAARAPSAASPAAAFLQLTFLPGEEATPSLAPDGESFVFAKRVNGQLDLFLQRVDGRNPVPLTASCAADDSEPAFSPDGRRIAYRSECAGGGIFVMGATGESARRVTDFGYSPAWSPDGRELAVVTEIPLVPYAGLSTISTLWAVEVETGKRRQVSEHDARLPSWSPDGRRIAFWGQGEPRSNRELWIVAADGSELAAERAVRSTEDEAADWNPVWSPDGSWLYYSSTRGGTMNLWRLAIDPATGWKRGEPEPVVVPSSWAGWISFARDGERFAFVDRNRRTAIFRAPFDSARGELAGEPRPVETGSIEVWSDGIDLAPDGSSVVFSTVGMPQHLMVARSEGGELRQITEGPDRYRQGTFSPDGAWIALQAARFPGRIALLRPDGSGLRELLTDRTEGWWPAWSPDGGRLAVSTLGEAYLLDLGATTANGSTETLPTPPDGMAFSPNSWSRDGRYLAGGLIANGAPAGIAIYALDERTYRVVSSDADAGGAEFLVDGQRLLWSTGRDIVVHDLDRGLSRVLRSVSPGSELASAVLAHDGRWIAWLEVTDESDIWLASFEPKASARP